MGTWLVHAAGAALLLGAVMTLGDFAWAYFSIRHTVTAGLLHGALVCLCLGAVIGARGGRLVRGILAGPVIGVLAAATFYALAPTLRYAAMFPAWMLFWILFGVLQARMTTASLGSGLGRGVIAALASGVAFYAVSGMWTTGRDPSGLADYVVRLCLWSFAFLPGFVTLFATRTPPRPNATW